LVHTGKSVFDEGVVLAGAKQLPHGPWWRVFPYRAIDRSARSRVRRSGV
jgi:hypothetical protein